MRDHSLYCLWFAHHRRATSVFQLKPVDKWWLHGRRDPLLCHVAEYQTSISRTVSIPLHLACYQFPEGDARSFEERFDFPGAASAQDLLAFQFVDASCLRSQAMGGCLTPCPLVGLAPHGLCGSCHIPSNPLLLGLLLSRLLQQAGQQQ